MTVVIYEINALTPGRIAIMPRPRGGDWLEDEVRTWRAAAIDLVVSLLTANEVADFDLVQEKSACEAAGIQFLAHPTTDRSVPVSKKGVTELATNLAAQLKAGKNIAIYCRQGLGPAPLVAICVLIMASVDLEEATHAVGAARGCPVPETAEQKQWIAEFANEVRITSTR